MTEVEEREQGIQAIIFLQAMVGIKEPRGKAERGWNGMAKWERESTIRTYNALKGRKTCLVSSPELLSSSAS